MFIQLPTSPLSDIILICLGNISALACPNNVAISLNLGTTLLANIDSLKKTYKCNPPLLVLHGIIGDEPRLLLNSSKSKLYTSMSIAPQ